MFRTWFGKDVGMLQGVRQRLLRHEWGIIILVLN